MTKAISFLFLLFLLSSCDPGYVVILRNQSIKDKNITVINDRRAQSTDSIALTGSLDKQGVAKITVFKDTNKNSYSFLLGKGKNAVLYQGIGGPDLSEKLVIDSSDTLALNGDKRVIITRQGMRGTTVDIKLE